MPPDDLPPTADTLLAESAWIAGLARSLVVDPGTADDVAQDAAVAAFTRAPADLRSPRGWLRRVVTRLASNERRSAARREAREVAAAPAGPAEAPDAIVARWEIRRRVVEAVLALDEPYRSTILARYFDGLPVAEAAARFGVPQETVRTRTRRGLDLLRGRLAHLDDGRGGRGVAAVVWLVGAEADAPLRVGRGAGALSAGGLLMAAATKWTLATAAVLVLGIGVVWTLRSDEPPPAEVADGGGVPTDPSAPNRPRTARAANDLGATAAEVAAGTGEAGPVDLDACDRDRDLHGVVVDGEGNPVAGASVAALRNDAWRLRIPDLRRMFEMDVVKATRTSPDGTFALRLGAAEGVGLRAEAEGFAAWESWDRQAGERVRIALGPGTVLTVTVRREDGAPVPGASVRLLGSPRNDQMVRAHGTTDAAGAVVLRGVPRGVLLTFLVEPTGVGPALQPSKKLDDLPEQTFEVVVPAGRDLTGRLVDAATGAPVPGGTVAVQGVHLAAVAAADDGTFTYRGFGGPDPTLSAKAPGYAHSVVRVAADVTEVSVPMTRGVAATGRVLDAQGSPVGGAVVSLLATPRTQAGSQMSFAATDAAADGSFRAADLLGGVPHVLTVRAAGHGTLRREVPLDGAPGAEVPLGDVVLGPARRVRVVAVGPDELPAPRQEVQLVFGEFTIEGGLGGAEVRRTDDLGRAAFPDVPPGSYVVRAGRDGPEVRVVVGDADPAVVRLRVGGPPKSASVATAAAGELVVTVVDEAGEPVGNAPVRIDFERGAPRMAQVSADGVVRVPCPSAPILVRTLAGAPFLNDSLGSEVSSGQRDVRVVLRRGAVISGRVLDPDGRPLAGICVSAYSSGNESYLSAPSDTEGAFTLHVAPGDPVHLEVQHRPGKGAQGPFPSAWRRGVAPGTDGVDLRLTTPAGTASLRVRVVDPEGAPIAGVAILVLPLGAGRYSRATTGDDGAAVVTDLPRAPATVVTFPRESAPAILAFAAPRAARVVAGEDEEVVLHALAAVHVRGRVVVPEGASTAHASVVATGKHGYAGVAEVSEDGTFDLALPSAADPRWNLECSVPLGARGREGTANGYAAVRAPAEGVEIRCVPAR